MNAAVFSKLLVLFAVVGLGWVAGRMRWLGSGDVARTLSNAAFFLFVPALLIRTSARLDLHGMPWHTLLAFFVPVLTVLCIVYAVGRWRMPPGRSAAEPSVRAIGVCFGNSVQVGIPVAAALFGEAGLAIHVAIVSVHALVLLTVLTALAELDLAREQQRQGSGNARLWGLLGRTARATIIHPVVLPVLSGLAFNAAGLHLPALADEFLQLLGTAVVPVCMVLIGLSLASYGVRDALKGALLITALKLLALPAAVLLIAHGVFGLSGLALAVVVMAAALPVGNNALMFAQRYEALEAQTTTATVFSTLGFVATAPLWLAALASIS